MEINIKNIHTLLSEFDIKPTKDNGQNFLINPDIAANIVNLLGFTDSDNAIEIGSGLGSITHFLKEKGDIHCVEIDSKLSDILMFLYKDITIYNQDALKFDFSEYNKIISNVPYSISTDLLEHILLSSPNLEKGVFMCQEEFVKRLLAKNGKDYGPLSILFSLVGQIKKDFIVPCSAFVPQPKCKSLVFHIDVNRKVEFNVLSQVYKLVKLAFSNRRKTLINNLIQVYNKEEVVNTLSKLGLNLNCRPEELSPNDFINIFFSLKNR